MRIAVLTNARSGSTSLYNLIESHLINEKYLCVAEPFNFHWRDREGYNNYDVDFFEIQSKNVFIKTFVSKFQIPQSYNDNQNEYWIWFFSYFDKVIILDRRDKILQSESLAYHIKQNNIRAWHKKQHYDLSNISKEELDMCKNTLIKDSELLNEFSKNGYPIYYFEDIFLKKDKSIIEKIFKYLDIQLDDTLYEQYIVSDTYKIRLDDNTPKFKGLI